MEVPKCDLLVGTWEEEEDNNKGNEASGKEALTSASSAELVADRSPDLSPKLDRPLFFRVSSVLSTYVVCDNASLGLPSICHLFRCRLGEIFMELAP